MPKNGLKIREVSATHFSSGLKKEDEMKCTRCVIHLLEAKDLLASDIETGKSDPICFLAIGPQNLRPKWDDLNYSENGILFSEVKNATIHPKWNSSHTFPMVIESVNELLKARIYLFVRDEDLLEDGTQSFDNLGEVNCLSLTFPHSHSSSFQATISLQDVLKQGKVVKKTAIVTSPQWIKLSKSSNMKRIEGFIKISVSIIFDEDDMSSLLQVRALFNQLLSLPLQQHTIPTLPEFVTILKRIANGEKPNSSDSPTPEPTSKNLPPCDHTHEDHL
jgi:hypothetical protein